MVSKSLEDLAGASKSKLEPKELAAKTPAQQIDEIFNHIKGAAGKDFTAEAAGLIRGAIKKIIKNKKESYKPSDLFPTTKVGHDKEITVDIADNLIESTLKLKKAFPELGKKTDLNDEEKNRPAPTAPVKAAEDPIKKLEERLDLVNEEIKKAKKDKDKNTERLLTNEAENLKKEIEAMAAKKPVELFNLPANLETLEQAANDLKKKLDKDPKNKILIAESKKLKKEVADLKIVKKLFEQGIPEIVIHGDEGKRYKSWEAENPEELEGEKRTYAREDKEGFKPVADIDALLSVELLNIAGINYELMSYMGKGESTEGKFHVDTGGHDGLAVIKIGSKQYTIYIDNHGEKKGEPSSMFPMYKTLWQTGMLTEEKIKAAGWTKERLEQMIAFDNEIDSLTYDIDERTFKQTWWRTPYALERQIPDQIPISFLTKMFKQGISPHEPLVATYFTEPIDPSLVGDERKKKTAEALKNLAEKQLIDIRTYLVRLEGGEPKDEEEKKKQEELAQRLLKIMTKARNVMVNESLTGVVKNKKEMEERGILTETPEAGKVLIDFVREYPLPDGKKIRRGQVKGGPIGALATGHDVFIKWDPEQNFLFITAPKKPEIIAALFKKVQYLFPHAELIRGAMIMVQPDKRDLKNPFCTTEELVKQIGLGEKDMSPEKIRLVKEKNIQELYGQAAFLDKEIESDEEDIRKIEVRLLEIQREKLDLEAVKFDINIQERKERMLASLSKASGDVETWRKDQLAKTEEEEKKEAAKHMARMDTLLTEGVVNDSIIMNLIGNRAFYNGPAFEILTRDIDLSKMGVGMTGIIEASIKEGQEITEFPKFKEAFEEKYGRIVESMKAEKGVLFLNLK